MPEIGEQAPDYTLPGPGGVAVSPTDQVGKWVVVYFYPRDDTPGCTTEAKDFTALADDFAAANAVVLGVSKDSVAKHGKFVAKYGLGVMLLSDAEGDVCERYGVWQKKKNYGKTYMGIVRTTFLIAPDGTIRQIWNKVKVAGHAQAVLETVRAD